MVVIYAKKEGQKGNIIRMQRNEKVVYLEMRHGYKRRKKINKGTEIVEARQSDKEVQNQERTDCINKSRRYKNKISDEKERNNRRVGQENREIKSGKRRKE